MYIYIYTYVLGMMFTSGLIVWMEEANIVEKTMFTLFWPITLGIAVHGYLKDK